MAMYQARLSLRGILWAVLPVQEKSGGGPNSLPRQQDRACLWDLHFAGRQLCGAATAFVVLLLPLRRTHVHAPGHGGEQQMCHLDIKHESLSSPFLGGGFKALNRGW